MLYENLTKIIQILTDVELTKILYEIDKEDI